MKKKKEYDVSFTMTDIVRVFVKANSKKEAKEAVMRGKYQMYGTIETDIQRKILSINEVKIVE